LVLCPGCIFCHLVYWCTRKLPPKPIMIDKEEITYSLESDPSSVGQKTRVVCEVSVDQANKFFSGGDTMHSIPAEEVDLGSLKGEFDLTLTITTATPRVGSTDAISGFILGKLFTPLIETTGDEANGVPPLLTDKALLLENGHVVWAVNGVGRVESSTRIDDGQPHGISVTCHRTGVDNTPSSQHYNYNLFVDGKRQGDAINITEDSPHGKFYFQSGSECLFDESRTEFGKLDATVENVQWKKHLVLPRIEETYAEPAELELTESKFFPAYESGTHIEYYSKSNNQWTQGTVHSIAHDNGFRYDLDLDRFGRGSRPRIDVPLSLFRAPLSVDASCAYYSQSERKWLPAKVLTAPLQKARNRNYKVQINGDTIDTSCLRHHFTEEDLVEVYRNAKVGWVYATVISTSHGDDPDLAEESHVQSSPPSSGGGTQRDIFLSVMVRFEDGSEEKCSSNLVRAPIAAL